MNRRVALVATAAAVLLASYPVAKLATAQSQPSVMFVQTAQKIDYKDGVLTLFERCCIFRPRG
jgi:hypothetical protein